MESNAVPRVTTTRMLLRVPEASDQRELNELVKDPDVQRFLGPSSPQVESMLAAWAKRSFGMFCLRQREQPFGFMGVCGFMVSPIDNGPELVCAVVKEVRGLGIAFEACEASLRWASESDLTAVSARVSNKNEKSLNLLRRLGIGPARTRTDPLTGERESVFVWTPREQ